jgi:ATP-dependent protease ClpP protease subunit
MIVRESEKWFDLSLDQSTRTLYMGSTNSDWEGNETGVDNFMAEYFVKGMHVLESKNSKPITVIMNNPGGDWYHGMAIYDAINCSPCEVTIKVYGYAMSMGSVILQSADHRVMMPNSRFMIHYGYDGKTGHAKIVYKWADEGKRINHQMENIYLDSMMVKESAMGDGHLAKVLTSILQKQNELEYPQRARKKVTLTGDLDQKREHVRGYLQEMLNYDTILTPQETIDLGLADEIYSIK